MTRTTWHLMVTAVIGLTLLSLAGRAPAGLPASCCVCECSGSANVCAPGTSVDSLACSQFCDNASLNNNTCVATFVNSSACADIAACQAVTGAPTLDAGGLAAIVVLLGGLGVLGVNRMRRRGEHG
jgi:hypothetical protein